MEDEHPADKEVLAQLRDPLDVEAFRNLMENAATRDQSAVDLVRAQPGVTSRKQIRRLCLKDKRRFFAKLLGAFLRAGRGGPEHDGRPSC